MSLATSVLMGLVTALLGVTAGTHVTSQLALNPALRALPAPSYVGVKQAIDRSFEPVMRPLTLGTVALTIAVTVLAALDGAAGAAVWGLVLICQLGALGAIVRGDLPINRAMAAWDEHQPPADWLQVRSRWEMFFLIRTGALIVAFALAILQVSLR